MIPKGRTLFAALVMLFAADRSQAADTLASYQVSPGDVIEIGIAALPDRTQRAMVQMDGTIILPEAGAIPVQGLTPTELQERMEAILPTKIFHFRVQDGREQIAVVKPSDITAVIAEYRPIYVTGDVLTPGQQTYRPLMTVRQALAVAGGVSLLRSRAAQTGPDPADLQQEYESLWTEYVKEYLHANRLRAELQNREDFDKSVPDGSPLPASVVEMIARTEADSLKIALADAQQEKAYLEKGIQDSAAQIDMLKKRQQDETDGVKADEEDLARVTKLYEAGNLTNTRLADVRRALLLSSSRALETSVELMRTKRQQDDFSRQLERAANQRSVTLLTDLKETNVRLAGLSVRLRTASEKLRPAGASARPVPIAGQAVRTQFTIVRKDGTTWRRLTADEDTEVAPGDTIEARLNTTLDDTPVQ